MHAFTLFLSGICRPKNRFNHRLLQSIIAEVVNNTVLHQEIGCRFESAGPVAILSFVRQVGGSVPFLDRVNWSNIGSHLCMECFVHQYYERREQIAWQTKSNLDTLANLPCTSSRFEEGVFLPVRLGTHFPSRIGWFFTWISNHLSCVWFLSHSLTYFWQSWHPIL